MHHSIRWGKVRCLCLGQIWDLCDWPWEARCSEQLRDWWLSTALQIEPQHLAAAVLQQCGFPVRIRPQLDIAHPGGLETLTGICYKLVEVQRCASQQEPDGGLLVKRARILVRGYQPAYTWIRWKQLFCSQTLLLARFRAGAQIPRPRLMTKNR